MDKWCCSELGFAPCPQCGPTCPGTKMIDGLVSPQDPHSFANHRQLLHTNTRQDKISSRSTYVQENTNQITGLSMIKTNCEVAPRIWGHELKHCACSARNNCALSETIGATLKKMQPHLSTVHFADHCSVSLASLAGQWRRIWCSWNPETKTSTKASHIECFNWWK